MKTSSIARIGLAMFAFTLLSGCYLNVGGATSIGQNVTVGTSVGIDPATGTSTGGSVSTSIGFP